MDFFTSSFTGAVVSSFAGFNRSANSTSNAMLASMSPLATGVSDSSIPATITTAPSIFNSTPFFGNNSLSSIRSNTTAFANDTLCWLSYWSYTEAAASWTKSQRQTSTTTFTRTSTISYTRPAVATTGNQSYTVLCDGLPRFDTEEEAQAAFQPVLLPTPVVTTSYITTNVIVVPRFTDVRPQCSIKDAAACSDLWILYASTRSRSLASWSASNVLTVSLAAPPTSVVVNGKTTPLPAADGALPILTLHGTPYPPNKSIYSIVNATSLTGRAIITPGGQGTFTWNGNDITALPYGPRDQNCNGPPSGTIDPSQCATAQCTIAATHVQLIYFPPPSRTRNLCANTSPGFDRFSVSIYSQPHVSTVVNSTTYWQDKAYVRYSALSAYKSCSMDNGLQVTTLPVGSVYSDQMIEVASSDLSSICSWRMNPALHVQPIGATAFPFNFDDLAGPIPASAYTCIPECLAGCSSIVSENWLTGLGLAVPSQIQKIDPAWASCVPYFLGVPDPPIALHSADNFLSTTADSPSKPTDPAPGTSPEAVVTATNKPQSSSDPKPTNQPDSPHDPNPPQNTKSPNNEHSSARPNNNPPKDPPRSSTFNDPPNGDPPHGQTPTLGPVTAPTAIEFTRTTPIPESSGQAANSRPNLPIMSAGGSPIYVDPSDPNAIVVGIPSSPGSQTLSAGGPPIVVSGTTISIAPTGGAVIMSGQSNLVPLGTMGDQTIWMDPLQPGVLLIGDPSSPEALKTLGTSSDSLAVISGTTISLARPTGSAMTPVAMSIMGLSLSLDPASRTLKIDGEHILQPGSPQISIKGHTVFFDPRGENVVIDGVSYPLVGLPSIVVVHDGGTSTLRLDGNAAAVTSASSEPLKVSDAASTAPSNSRNTDTTRTEGESFASDGAGTTSTPAETSKPGSASRQGFSSWLCASVLLLLLRVMTV